MYAYRENLVVIGIILGVLLTLLVNSLASKQPVAVEEAHAEEVAIDPNIGKPVRIEVRINWTRERIDQEIDAKAAEYHVSADLMKELIECESGYDPKIQARAIVWYGREQSYGLAQIHLPDHDVSYDEAIDPAFAVDFMAKNIAKGNAWMWNCLPLI